MSTPCIVIIRHQPGFYEWSVMIDEEKFDSDVGDTSIAACLSSAAGSLPYDFRLVEVRYRGVHMGTFEASELKRATAAVAQRLAGTHSALTRDN